MGWSGRSSRAGRYAEERYWELRGRWRRRVLQPLIAVVLPFVAVSVGVTLFTGGWWRWSGGVVLGLGLALFVIAWQTPPHHIERWAAGAEGERRTERVLKRLRHLDWHVVHDLEWPGAGNIDTLVIGPGGVYVLDSKVWGGVVRVDSTGATITPRDNPDAAWTARGQTGRMSRAGTAVARALAARTGHPVPAATPVVVVWAPFPARVATAGGIAYVAGEHLADWLLAQSRQLHREQLGQLTSAATDDLLAASP